jgi:hypothetical protein
MLDQERQDLFYSRSPRSEQHPGMFYNKNEWQPDKWGYVADESCPAPRYRGPMQPALRLSFQVSSATK